MDGQEIELKLAIPPACMVRLKRHPAVTEHRQARPVSTRLRSIYYDTPDRRLARAGITVRLRLAGRKRLQTVKTAGTRASGLFSRREWEAAVTAEQPDTAMLRATGLPPLQDEAVLAALVPLFTTTVSRTAYQLRGEGWQVELALDQGEITAGDHREIICEAELELREGAPPHLFALARRIVETIPARLLAQSKSDRGHDLAAGITPGPVKAPPVALHGGMTAGEAFAAIARNCLHHLLANERALVERDDPEAIHQMRVALRRLRSAFGIFRPLIQGPDLDRLKGEIKWLLGLLGPARDAEVFLAEIVDPVVLGHPGHGGLQALQARWRDQRAQEQARARTAVAERRFTTLLLDLGAWIENAAWVENPLLAADSPLPAFAAATLDKLSRKMRKAGGKDLRALAPHHRHRVRIMGKRLRYAGEFFTPLYRKSDAKKYLAILAELQDLLGEANDMAVAGPRLASLHHHDDLAWAAGMVTGWHEARSPDLLLRAQKAWKRLLGEKKFWRDRDA